MWKGKKKKHKKWIKIWLLRLHGITTKSRLTAKNQTFHQKPKGTQGLFPQRWKSPCRVLQKLLLQHQRKLPFPNHIWVILHHKLRNSPGTLLWPSSSRADEKRIPQGVLCCTKAKAARDPTAHSQHWRSNTRYLPFNSVLTSKLGHRRETAQPLSSISIKEQLHTLQENAQILAVLHKRGSWEAFKIASETWDLQGSIASAVAVLHKGIARA